MGFSFVPVTIASLSGVQRADAGVASGLVNTSRQIGGAIGIAAVSAIAATSTTSYAEANAVAASSGVALSHGFQTGLYVLTGLVLVAAVVAFSLVRSAAPTPECSRAGTGGVGAGRYARRSRAASARLVLAVRELRKSRGARRRRAPRLRRRDRPRARAAGGGRQTAA
jgi:hypothetical protein